MLRNFLWCMVGTLLFFQPQAAGAEWIAAGAPLRLEPPVKLVSFEGGLLALQAKRLWVVSPDGESARQAFSLRTQTDGLVDIVAMADRWVLASRRTIWTSEDQGYSWRMLVSLTAKDPNEWLAVLPQDGSQGSLLIAASRQGLQRIDPGRSAAWTRFGRTPVARAISTEGALAVQVPAGIHVLGPSGLQRLPVRGSAELAAFYPYPPTMAVATDLDVQFCGELCASAGTLPGVKSLAVNDEGYWAATSDAVWFRPAGDTTWNNRRAGLSPASPGPLAVRQNNLWMLTDLGLYSWRDHHADPSSTHATVADTIHPFSDWRRGPPMSEVRRMVLQSLNLHPPTVATWRERARWRAAAPRLALTVRHDDDERSGQSLSNTLGVSTTENRIILGPEGSSVTRASRQNFHYGVVATWQLDELVFNREEVLVSDRLVTLQRRKETVVLDATRIYFDRLRTLAELSTAEELLRRIELELRLAELTADLDFYTDGGFSAALERSE